MAIEPLLRGWGLSPGTAQLLAIAIVVVLLTVVTIILGELVPKVYALRNKERVCLVISPPMQWFFGYVNFNPDYSPNGLVRSKKG